MTNGNDPGAVPYLGDVLSLRTPRGLRLYRIVAAAPHRVQLKPLNPEQSRQALAVHNAQLERLAWSRGFANLGEGIELEAAALTRGARPPADAEGED